MKYWQRKSKSYWQDTEYIILIDGERKETYWEKEKIRARMAFRRIARENPNKKVEMKIIKGRWMGPAVREELDKEGI